jgi:mono/diheme cytochrome c family protein
MASILSIMLVALSAPAFLVAAAAAALTVALPLSAAIAADPPAVARGKYLVAIASCNDCHTPSYFFGKPDMARFLGGSEVGFEMPGSGVFYGPNLTPDKATGLGNWTDAQIVAAIQEGKRPDGRMLAPSMPWHAFAALTKPDVNAIVAFLRSLPPVVNKVPGPFGPTDTPTSFVMKIVPPPAK